MCTFTLITGPTSGIGLSLSQELSKSRNLLLLGRDKEKLENTLSLCNSNNEHKIFTCDLNRDKDILASRLRDYINTENIKIDSFVHCAGLTKILPLKVFPISIINEIFNVNIFSAIEIIKALLKRENNNSLRNIIFISALRSIRGEIANSIYASSKGALNSLTYSLAKEFAPKIRVNSVLPGAIVTPMSENYMKSKEGLEQLKDYPLGFGKPEDVIGTISFLLSEKSSWITGQTINVDGGRSIL